MATRRYIMKAIVILQLVVTSQTYGEGLAGQIFQEKYQQSTDGKEVTNNKERNNSKSREDLADDAKTQGATGAGVAAGLGITLFMTGLRMSLVPELITHLAGVDLMAKGALELAQAAANGQGAGYNSGQKEQLNGTQRVTDMLSGTDLLNNPDVQKALDKQGITPEEFKSLVSNAQTQSGSDMMKGGGGDLDPEISAKAQELANEQMSSIFASVIPKENGVLSSTITASADKENEKKSDGSEEGTANSNSLVSGGWAHSDDKASSKDASFLNSNSEKSFLLAQKKNTDSLSQNLGNSENKSASSSGFEAMLNKLFGKSDSTLVEKNEILQGLSQLGIQLPVKGFTVFDLAHRNYRKFGKSRRMMGRVASR